MQKIILFSTILCMPIIHASAFVETSSDRAASSTDKIGSPAAAIPTLQESALQKLILHPRLLAQNFQQFASLYPYQQQMLFTESVHRALNKQLGLRALTVKPDMPLITRVLNNACDPVFSPEGNLLALSSWNYERRQWNLHIHNASTGKVMYTFEGERNPVFSPDGTILASYSWWNPDEMRLHNPLTGQLINTYK